MLPSLLVLWVTFPTILKYPSLNVVPSAITALSSPTEACAVASKEWTVLAAAFVTVQSIGIIPTVSKTAITTAITLFDFLVFIITLLS